MAGRELTFRIKSEGKADLIRDQNEVRAGFDRVYDAAERGAANATTAADRHLQKMRAFVTANQAAAAAQANQERFNALLGVGGGGVGSARDSADVFIAQGRAMEEMDDRARRLRAALDPLGAAQDRLNDELAEYQRLANAGRISAQELASAQALARRQFDETTAALGRNTNGLTRNQVASRLNLTRQGADVLVTGAMGMNPAMIALQQGPQILDALATSGIRASAGMIALGAAVGTAAAAVGVLAAGWVTGERDALALERAVNGLGRTSGLTRAELERLTDAAAENGRVSVASAREQAVAYLNTGRIGRDNIQGLIEIGRDYASVMGMDAAEATQSLSRAMLDPRRAARELGAQFGALSVEQIRQIDNLVKAGRLFDAQAALLDGLRSSIDGHADDVGKITSAWDAASRAVSNFWTGLGQAMWETDDERLGRLNRQIDRLRSGANALSPTESQNGRQLSRLIAERDALQTTIEVARAEAERRTAQAQTNQAGVQALLEEEARRSRGRSAEAEARREEQRRRRAEDSAAAFELEIARLTNDQDLVRSLEAEARQRDRIRDLIDAGATAEAARTQAAAEMARLAEAQGAATVRLAAEIGRSAQVESARLAGERAFVRELEDEERLRQRIESYLQTKLSLEQATANAMADQQEFIAARAAAMEREVEAARRSRELELMRLEGRSDQDPALRAATRTDSIQRRAREIEEREGLDFGRAVERATQEIDQELTATARGALRGGLRGFIDDIRQGGIGDALGNQFERASDRAIDRLLDAILSTDWSGLFNGGGGKGAGGWISAGLNFLFGRNAVGTESWRGGLTWVGENGPELIGAPRGARITPAFRAQSEARMGGAGAAPAIVFDLSGAVMTEDLLRQMQDMVARGQAQIRGEVPAIAVGAVSQARQRRVIG